LDFTIEEKFLDKYRGKAYENTIFKLKSEHSQLNGLSVLMKDLNIHPGTQRPFHVDFYAPDMSQDVRVDLEVRISGKAKGIADGGYVQLVLRHVTVDCSPLNIPEYVEANVSDLGLNTSLHVSDLVLPEGVKLVTSSESTVATCTPAVTAEEEAPATPDAAAPAAAPAEKAKAPK
jgi:large subunit ribosomal protein L25